MCLAGAVIASWFVIQEVVASNIAFYKNIYQILHTDSVDSLEFI